MGRLCRLIFLGRVSLVILFVSGSWGRRGRAKEKRIRRDNWEEGDG